MGMTPEYNNEEMLDDAPLPDNQRGGDEVTEIDKAAYRSLDISSLDIELERTKMDYLKALSAHQEVQAIGWQYAFNIITFLNRGPDKDPEVSDIEKKVYEIYQAKMSDWRATTDTIRQMKRFQISTFAKFYKTQL